MLGPLIVQSDHTVLLEVAHPTAEEARHALAVFAELERAPEHIHTYRITKLGLWNARAAGHTAAEIIATLEKYAKFPLPAGITADITDTVRRYGILTIERAAAQEPLTETATDTATAEPESAPPLLLKSTDPAVLTEVAKTKKIAPLLTEKIDEHCYRVAPWARGTLKQLLLARGWPAEDLAGYTPGDPHPINLTQNGWELRDYQAKATAAFAAGGSGVVVLPCGAGKTIVGAAAMAALGVKTLILVTNTVSIRQWRAELLRRTDLQPADIGEYSGQLKEIKPVTIASYQILTSRSRGSYRHLGLLDAQNWGLIIYDEVHLLPAPVFKLTADLQARRRLGLTATLIREDGREGDVFTLIGPKRFDAPWKEIEAQGYIAPAECWEVRVEIPQEERLHIATADEREKYRIAASSPAKIPVLRALLQRHSGESILVIGQYLEQLHELQRTLGVPLITGETPIAEREELFQSFRTGETKVLIVSKVANFSVDLPDASCAIQVSGAFGSRQEEAQRLGRVLRPKADGKTASYYTLVAQDTVEQEYAAHRQRFLAEQGYSYNITDSNNLLGTV